MKQILKIAILLVILFSCTKPTVRIGNNAINVVIADEQKEWTSGLQNISSMSEDSGMLFIFPTTRNVTFWMKDTLIPLDLMFIDENNVIQFMRKNVKPCTQDPCTTYTHNNIKYVLEVNAGYADEKNIKTGDKLVLKV